jgi:CheY-like chemotaxis protein
VSSRVPTLLVADDSAAIQRVVELIFANENVRVVAVGDGNQAIQRLDAAPPDIVLADVGMPGRDGYDVARYVKESPRLAHIPVVLLAGAFDPVDQARAAEARCDGVLAKPFEPHVVVNRVQQLLAGPHAIGGAPAEIQPASVSAEATPPPASGESATRADQLDEYFDRLGTAFAERLRTSIPAADPPMSADESRPSNEPAESTVTEVRPHQPAAPKMAGASGTLPATPAEVTTPTLADRFAALLAAQHDAPPRDISPEPVRMRPVSPPNAMNPINDDEIVEQVSRRVLAHLTDRVVRETVADIVSKIAEQMVREEIERIKAAIK